jgi:hypothetical protein
VLNPKFSPTDFPYTPLPENVRRAALDALSSLGFVPLENYNICSFNKNELVKTNILAFAHPIHRIPEYSGVTVFNATNGYDDKHLIKLLATSTAPFHLLFRDDKFSFWAYPVENEPNVIENHIACDQLGNFFRENKNDLNPQRIIDVKQGDTTFDIFYKVKPSQLSSRATQVNGEALVKNFGLAVSSLRNNINRLATLSETEKNRLSTMLSTQLLGATILGGTGVLGEEIRLSSPSLDRLIKEASRRFGRYFNNNIFAEHSIVAEEAYHILQRICYASFMPDMLQELYKKACTQEECKESGIYDTSLHLARRIWENIPLEYLAPQKRVVADMICGWGNFLIAGHERLSALKDMEGLALCNHVYGNGNLPLAAHLTGLGLLLATSQDSWSIDQNDALEWPWLRVHQPTLIVGNPRFKASQEEANLLSQKPRFEKANLFLRYALDRLAPGGYLAMVLPRSFLPGGTSPDLRKYLQENCDLFELWELPAKVSSDSAARTSVLFVQKQERKSQYLVRMRTICPKTYETFLQKREANFLTVSTLVQDQSIWNKQRERDTNTQDPPTVSEKANWSLSGVVKSIDTEHGTITLSLRSFDKPQKVQIAPSMPGWMLRTNAAFHTKIPREYIENDAVDFDSADWGAFYPQHYTYLTDEELLDELARIFHRDDT